MSKFLGFLLILALIGVMFLGSLFKGTLAVDREFLSDENFRIAVIVTISFIVISVLYILDSDDDSGNKKD